MPQRRSRIPAFGNIGVCLCGIDVACVVLNIVGSVCGLKASVALSEEEALRLNNLPVGYRNKPLT